LQAIPEDAAVIIKINDLEDVLQKIHKESGIWQELKNTSSFRHLAYQMQFLDSVLISLPDARQLLLNNPSYLSLHYAGKDKIGFLHVYRVPNSLSERKIHALISRFVENKGTVSERNYDGKMMFDVRLLHTDKINIFSYTIYRDLFMLSFSSLLLENALRQIDGDLSIADQEGFNQAFSTAGKNVNANLFLNFRNLPKSLSVGINNEYKAEIRSFNTFADWGELDANIMRDVFLLNGFILASDSGNCAASVFKHQSPQKITADEASSCRTGALRSRFSINMDI
jgi:hypothetical protein